ncbi:MAG: RNA chaperone Hfq [Clostridia bacterium]|nr:RNA chaperone Hfq [Clostridia bacterium]
MAQNTGNLQDLFLNQVRKEKVVVNVYLTNGFQCKGIVKGFDSFVVLIESEGKQTLLYKHAISTINPTKPVNKMLGTEEQPISFV